MIGEKEWVPTKMVKGVIELLVNMLANPDVNEAPINEEAANTYKNDRAKFNEEAKKWTQKHAK